MPRRIAIGEGGRTLDEHEPESVHRVNSPLRRRVGGPLGRHRVRRGLWLLRRAVVDTAAGQLRVVGPAPERSG